MHFLLDENVPTSVATVLEEFGHTVERAIDVVPAAILGALVPIVAFGVCAAWGIVLGSGISEM